MRRALASAAAALLLAGCGGGAARSAAGAGAAARDADRRHRRQGRHLRGLRRRAREQITRGLDGYRGRALETTGSVQNLLRLRDGKAQIALTLGDTALDAVEGREAFDQPVPMRALAQIYPSYVQLVTRADAGIRTLAGPRRASASASARPTPGPRSSPSACSTSRASTRDRAQRLGVAESAQALEDGDIDAFFWSGGVPTERVTQLAKRTPLALVDLGRWTREMRTRWGGVYEPASIPAGAYGLAARSRRCSIPNYVVVDEHMDAGLAYDLTKLLFDARRVTDRARAQRVIAPRRAAPRGAGLLRPRAGPDGVAPRRSGHPSSWERSKTGGEPDAGFPADAGAGGRGRARRGLRR